MSVTKFLEAFYPDVEEPIWLRVFDPKHLPRNLHGYAQNIQTCRAQLAGERAFQERLKALNNKQGIYFVVNAGGTGDEDITRINAIFCESDLEVEPDNGHILKQHDIFDNETPLSPSIRIETRKSVHAYWLCSEVLSNDDFLGLQQGLIRFFKSDPAISNLARVMRVPFFRHVHYENGYQYQPIKLHTFRPDWRYTVAELKEAFPYLSLVKEPVSWERPAGRMETLEDVKAELRARIMATDSWKAHGKWGSANGRCHNGEGDTGLRIDLASGAVTCWSKCSLKQILEAFGLELPKSRRFEYVPPRQQKSELYQWYQDRKKGKQ